MSRYNQSGDRPAQKFSPPKEVVVQIDAVVNGGSTGKRRARVSLDASGEPRWDEALSRQ